MVGSTVLVIPMNFLKTGFVMSILIMLFIGIVLAKTCHWVMLHNKHGETDVGDTVKRILGNKWFYVFSSGSSLFLLMIGIIYFILINNMVYPIILFIDKKIDGENILPK